MHQLFEEPTVNHGQSMNLFNSISYLQGFRYNEDAHIRSFTQRLVDVFDLNLMILYKTVHPLSYHSQTFLKGFFKGATYRHHFSYAFHGRTKLTLNTVELGQIPAWYLDDHIVESGLKESTGGLGDRILQVKESVAQAELGCNEGQWIACRFRCQC